MKGETLTAVALLARGANPNAKNKYGVTALMFAARTGDIEMVKALLAKGANPTIQTPARKSAMDFAKGSGNDEIERILKQAGAKAGPPDFVSSAKSMQAAKGNIVAERKFIVQDQRNQLMWLRPALSPDKEPYLNWLKAKLYCEQLVFAGYDDWRLPTEQETRRLSRSVIDKVPSHSDDIFWSLTETTELRDKDGAATFQLSIPPKVSSSFKNEFFCVICARKVN
jgi:hypothetical protein